MKEKTKIFVLTFVLISVVALLTTIVVADSSRKISDIRGTGYTKIDKTDAFEFDLQTLVNSKNAYCIQHETRMKTGDFGQ